MKAYHVYVFNGPYPSKAETEPRPFEWMTHIYSCLNHHNRNPGIPLAFVTDSRTKKYYDDLNITALYDEVITDLHDDYPRERISSAFWASPKIWAMTKLQPPFVIFDTDLVLHKPLRNYTDCDLLYLHRETSAIYPNIFDIKGPPGFVWDDAMAWSFKASLPMNCAVVGMFNGAFASDYASRYFDFVLDAPGEMIFATENSHKMYPPAAAQIVAEQWLLAALATYWKSFKGVPIKARAVCKALWTHDLNFTTLDDDARSDMVAADVASNFYHLWAAKHMQNIKIRAEHHYTRNMLINGRHIAENSPRFGPVKDLFNTLIAHLLS